MIFWNKFRTSPRGMPFNSDTRNNNTSRGNTGNCGFNCKLTSLDILKLFFPVLFSVIVLVGYFCYVVYLFLEVLEWDLDIVSTLALSSFLIPYVTFLICTFELSTSRIDFGTVKVKSLIFEWWISVVSIIVLFLRIIMIMLITDYWGSSNILVISDLNIMLRDLSVVNLFIWTVVWFCLIKRVLQRKRNFDMKQQAMAIRNSSGLSPTGIPDFVANSQALNFNFGYPVTGYNRFDTTSHNDVCVWADEANPSKQSLDEKFSLRQIRVEGGSFLQELQGDFSQNGSYTMTSGTTDQNVRSDNVSNHINSNQNLIIYDRSNAYRNSAHPSNFDGQVVALGRPVDQGTSGI